MKAVILAAGRGSRLLPKTEDRPKCLIEIAGKPFLRRQLDIVAQTGIRDIGVVTGYRPDMVDEVIRDARSDGLNITNIFNPFYEVSDNLASVWMSKAFFDDDFILMNGDTLFEPAVPETLLAAPRAAVTVTIDQKDAYDSDDMKVQLEENRVLAIGKTLRPGRVDGESIGLLRFQDAGPRIFWRAVDDLLHRPDGLKSWFLRAVDDLAKGGLVTACSIKGKRWAEMDTLDDIPHVEALFR